MKPRQLFLFLGALFVSATCHAGVVARFADQVAVEKPLALSLALRYGETVDLEYQFLNYNTPMDLTGASVVLHAVTNGMPAGLSYQVTGQVGRVDAPEKAANGWAWIRLPVDHLCPAGQSSMGFVVAVSNGASALLRASGTLRLTGTAAGSTAAPQPTLVMEAPGAAAAVSNALASALASAAAAGTNYTDISRTNAVDPTARAAAAAAASPAASVVRLDLSGSDDSGTRGRLDKPFATLDAAAAVLQVGDVLLLGVGTWAANAPISMPNGVTFRGSGVGRSIINSTRINIAHSNTFEHLSMTTPAGIVNHAPIVVDTGAEASGLLLDDVDVQGWEDTIYVLGTFTGTNTVRNSHLTTYYDCLIGGNSSAATFVFDGATVEVVGLSTPETVSSCVRWWTGGLVFIRSTLRNPFGHVFGAGQMSSVLVLDSHFYCSPLMGRNGEISPMNLDLTVDALSTFQSTEGATSITYYYGDGLTGPVARAAAALTNAGAFATAAEGVAATNAQTRVASLETHALTNAGAFASAAQGTAATNAQSRAAALEVSLPYVAGTATNALVSATNAQAVAVAAVAMNGGYSTNLHATTIILTNSTTFRSGALNGTNGVFFTPANGSNYWILLP